MNTRDSQLSRRNMLKTTLAGAALYVASKPEATLAQTARLPLRLGGQVF